MEEIDKNKLDRLEHKLYARKSPQNSFDKRGEFDEEVFDNNTSSVGLEWKDEKEGGFDNLASRMAKITQSKSNFIKKFFWVAASLFVVSLVVAGLVFFGGMNFISSENVDIKIVGQSSIGGGQEASFDIVIMNQNTTSLESVSLLVEYPLGTKVPNNLSEDLARERFNIESIKSGESYTKTISGVFFGEKESIKKIKLSLEYRVENSSATFFKEKDYEFSISSAPIIISATYSKEINSSQDFSFDIEIASNSSDNIENLLLKVEYPFGFILNSSSPKPFAGDNIWRFDSLSSGDKRKISVNGSIIGQDNEEKVFRISSGTASEEDDRSIAVLLSEIVESVLIKKPFIGINTSIAGSNGDYVGRGGSQIEGLIYLQNNLPDRLFNTQIEVSFSGGAFDELSVSPRQGGFFRSIDDTIIWESRSTPDLSEIEPGDTRDFSFALTPLTYNSLPKSGRPEIIMTIKAKGERVLESGSVDTVSSVESRKISLVSDVGLSAKTLRSLGSFENSGPIPPRANSKTTYTVVWSITNSFNQIGGVEVRASLPSYVRWTDLAEVDGGEFGFNPTTGEVVWSVGSVLPNTGISSSPKEARFQVEIVPSTSQTNTAPIIVGEATLIGLDKSTGSKVRAVAPPATTNFSLDPIYKSGDDKVVP
ncbi:MAG: hypothetical protein AAB392_02680 [Patescibacteria group bacterium]